MSGSRWKWFWVIQTLSLSRVALVFVFVSISPFPNLRYLALTVYLGAGITDFFDGRLARAKSLVSDLGGALDVFGDRYFSVISCLYVGFRGVDKWVLAVILLRELFSVALRMVRHDGKPIIVQNRIVGGVVHILIATGTCGFIVSPDREPMFWFYVPFYAIALFYLFYFPFSLYRSWPAIRSSVMASLNKPS